MNIAKEIRALDKKGVYIHYDYDHYEDVTNCNFSIEFIKRKKEGKYLRIHQTGWYGDNHEYGDVFNVMIASIKLAKWFLKNDNLKKYLYYDTVKETVTKEGHKRFCDGLEFKKKMHGYIQILYSKSYRNFLKKEGMLY